MAIPENAKIKGQKIKLFFTNIFSNIRKKIKIDLKTLFWALGIIIGSAIIIVITVGIGIYHYNWNNKFTQTVSRIFWYPVAVVGTQVVPYYQLQENLDITKHFYAKSGQPITDTSSIRGPILDELIEDAIIAQEAPKYHIKVTNQEIDDQLVKLETENGGAEKVKSLLLDLYGINVNQFKKLIKTQLLKEKAKSEIPLKIHAYHILIKVDAAANAATHSEKLAQINDIAQKIQSGSLSFQDAAKQFSEDDTTKDKGGDLGWVVRGQVVVCNAQSKEFDNVAFELPDNKVSEPVTTDCGYHLILVTEKSGWVDKNYDDWLKDVKSKMNVWRIVK